MTHTIDYFADEFNAAKQAQLTIMHSIAEVHFILAKIDTLLAVNLTTQLETDETQDIFDSEKIESADESDPEAGCLARSIQEIQRLDPEGDVPACTP